MKGFRVFDVIENRYSDKEFFIDKDGKLYVRAVHFDHETATRVTVTIEEADTSRYIVEESTELTDKIGKEIFKGDVPESHGIKYELIREKGKAWELRDREKVYFLFENHSNIKVVGTIHDAK